VPAQPPVGGNLATSSSPGWYARHPLPRPPLPILEYTSSSILILILAFVYLLSDRVKGLKAADDELGQANRAYCTQHLKAKIYKTTSDSQPPNHLESLQPSKQMTSTVQSSTSYHENTHVLQSISQTLILSYGPLRTSKGSVTIRPHPTSSREQTIIYDEGAGCP